MDRKVGVAASTAPAVKLERLANNEELHHIEQALTERTELAGRISLEPTELSGGDVEHGKNRIAASHSAG